MDKMIRLEELQSSPYLLLTRIATSTIASIFGPTIGLYVKHKLEQWSLYKGILTKLKPGDVKKVDLESVEGQEKAKATMLGIVDRVLDPDEDDKGQSHLIILDGPPGTGKTYLFKGVMNHLWEKKAKFDAYTLECEMLYGKEPGVGTRLLKNLGERIKHSKHDVIFVFADEVDAISSRKDPKLSSDQGNTILTFLKLTNGLIDLKGKTVYWLCATNNYERLDDAIMSRVERRISMERPDNAILKKLCERYFKQYNLGFPADIDWPTWFREAKGFVGRDIDILANQLRTDKKDEMRRNKAKQNQASTQKRGRKKTPKIPEAPLQLTQEEIYAATRDVRHKISSAEKTEKAAIHSPNSKHLGPKPSGVLVVGA